MHRIERFDRLGISGSDISDLVMLTPHSKDALRPSTRGYVYRGTLQGIPIVIKPYQTPHEAEVVKVFSRSPFSLVLDQNERYLVEAVAQGSNLESAYNQGNLKADDLSARLANFIAALHRMGISHNHTHEGHLFIEDGRLKATDLGEARLAQPSGFVGDIITGLEYLRDTLNRQELRKAVEAFRKVYACNYDAELFSEAVRRHLKFAGQSDPLRSFLG